MTAFTRARRARCRRNSCCAEYCGLGIAFALLCCFTGMISLAESEFRRADIELSVLKSARLLPEGKDVARIGTSLCRDPLSASRDWKAINAIVPATRFMLGSSPTYLLVLILFALPIAARSPYLIDLNQPRSSVVVGRSDLFSHGRPMACRARIG